MEKKYDDDADDNSNHEQHNRHSKQQTNSNNEFVLNDTSKEFSPENPTLNSVSTSVSLNHYKYVGKFLESHNKPIYAIKFFPFEFSSSTSTSTPTSIPTPTPTPTTTTTTIADSTSLANTHANTNTNTNTNTNPETSNLNFIFATIGANRASIYKCMHNNKITLMQTYLDEAWDEIFHACVWSIDQLNDNHPLLIIGGHLGVIKIIDCGASSSSSSSSSSNSSNSANSNSNSNSAHTHRKHRAIIAHGYAINHLSAHPSDFNLILSASEDHSIRLWNIQTKYCLAIIAGHHGHRAGVLCANFHLSGHYIISGGLDHAIKIWHLNDRKQHLNIRQMIQHSYEVDPRTHENTKPRFVSMRPPSNRNADSDSDSNSNSNPDTKLRKYHTKMIQFAVFSSHKIHSQYVDDCRFIGDLIASKSTESLIKIWKAPIDFNHGMADANDDNDDGNKNKNKNTNHAIAGQPLLVLNVVTYAELRYQLGDHWFMKFALNEDNTIIAVGNKHGQLFVWNLDDFFEMNAQIRMQASADAAANNGTDIDINTNTADADADADDNGVNETEVMDSKYGWHTFLTPKFVCAYKPLILTLPKCNCIIRDMTLNRAGTLLVSCDNATVYRYEHII